MVDDPFTKDFHHWIAPYQLLTMIYHDRATHHRLTKPYGWLVVDPSPPAMIDRLDDLRSAAAVPRSSRSGRLLPEPAPAQCLG